MSEQLPITFSGIIELLSQLKLKIEDILAAIDLPEGDIRRWCMIEIRTLCNTIGYIPLVLCYAYENAIETRKVEMGYMLGVTDQKELVQGLLDPFNITAKASFVTMVQFSLENVIAKILEALGYCSKESFSQNISSIIHHSGLTQSQEKLERAMIPACLRNTLHRDGYHTKEDRIVKIGFVTYEFIKDQKAQCASWGHIFYLFLNILSIYQELFLSQRISRIKMIPR